MRKPPWQKSVTAMSKYDWLTAICHNLKHQRRTRDLRVAIALMNVADSDTMLAWPTQETLAELSGLADVRQVRSAIASLRGTGAIEVVALSELYEDTKEKLAGKRKARGKAYRLKLFWAQEIMEASTSPATMRQEPEKLKTGKLAKRTAAVRSKRTVVVRSKADCDSPAYTLKETKDTKGSTEGTISFASTREANAYAIASRGDPHLPLKPIAVPLKTIVSKAKRAAS